MESVLSQNFEVGGVNFNTLLIELELQELDHNPPSSDVYSQMLSIYLLQNDLTSAKFLWKRIPEAVKNASPELCHVWEIGKKLWRKDYQGVYECLSKDWGVQLKPVMEALLESTRQHCLDLISTAYSCISLQDVVNNVGVTGDRLLEITTERGWTFDGVSNVFFPQMPETKVKIEDDDDRYLAELTHYISFLEN